MDIKEEIDGNTIIVRDFTNIPLMSMNRSLRQKINKETISLNDILYQVDITDIYRTFHPKPIEYTFFSSACGTFSRINHILGHKTSLDKFKKIKIISCIFSNNNSMKIQINHKKKNWKKKPTNTGRLNNMILNNQLVNDKSEKK